MEKMCPDGRLKPEEISRHILCFHVVLHISVSRKEPHFYLTILSREVSSVKAGLGGFSVFDTKKPRSCLAFV